MMTPLRQAVIAEAQRWLGARWHHEACVPYYACDCAQLLVAVYSTVGIIERPILDAYSRQWALHQDEEKFLAIMERYAHPTDTPQPGDIAVWKIGRTYSHGAIIINWPTILHADIKAGVVHADASTGYLADRKVKFYRVL